MTATVEMIVQVRRMTAEPTEATYNDAALAAIIEMYAVLDGYGEEPWIESTTSPGMLEVNPDWTATYDLAAAAVQVWSEKAAALAGNYDFKTADQSFSRSQAYEQAMKQARYWQSRRRVENIRLRPHPKPPEDDEDDLSN
jgi:hypothetical protein